MTTLIIIFLASLLGTIIGVMSGGGSSIISLPLYLWAGVPLPLAIATHKLYAAFTAPIAARNYLKGLKIDWKFLLIFAGIGLIGAYFGVQFVLAINAETLKTIIGIIIIIFVIYSYFQKDLGLKTKKIQSFTQKNLPYPFALIMGFYEGILGSGNGIAFTILTTYSRGYDMISALGHYNAVAFFWVSFAAILYIQKGFFDPGIMLAAILGASIGGYIGSKYAKHKGNRFIKIVFIIVGLILGLKLSLNL
jgi:uncharacterized membrane protein YfcA